MGRAGRSRDAWRRTRDPNAAGRILQHVGRGVAEIELSLLSRQCLKPRVPDAETLRREVDAWQQARNADQARIHWTFRLENARKKLKRLYPSLSA